MTVSLPSLEICSLQQQYREGRWTPDSLVDAILAELEKFAEYNLWIRVLSRAELTPYLDNLRTRDPSELPLYGVPFAIKDNIDLAGVDTTAGCEAFAKPASESAFVVQCLIAAGAIPIGKTNLDQFATGLVGTRSADTWGICKNAFDPDYIAGGSSSGSAVAVALGLVSFALGTDTAGSGRVPAAFNQLLGLKPSRGLLSCRGVVPACRSLDCVSIFALTAADANRVLACAARYDAGDCYSRVDPSANLYRQFGLLAQKPVLGIIDAEQLQTFGDDDTVSQYQAMLERLAEQGFALHTIDFEPFMQAAKLLYEGPWVAERLAAVGDYLPHMLDVTASIIGAGEGQTAAQAFSAQYALQAFKQQCDQVWETVDMVITPTTPSHYTIEQVQAEPLLLNSQLGYYTNFMNLLDYAAVAVPAGKKQSGLPFGITLFAPAFEDLPLLSMANVVEGLMALPLGATGFNKSPQELPPAQDGWITLAVCGAHLQGLPLNWQLLQRRGQLLGTAVTAACYRFYALAGGPPKRPGLIRTAVDEGYSIDVELWRLPAAWFGSFVAAIPAPLGIGKVELDDGRWVVSFICEGYGVEGAEDISARQSWRAYLQAQKA